MKAVPNLTPVTSPFGSTVTMDGDFEVQVVVVGETRSAPSEGRMSALKAIEAFRGTEKLPSAVVGEGLITSTEAGATAVTSASHADTKSDSAAIPANFMQHTGRKW